MARTTVLRSLARFFRRRGIARRLVAPAGRCEAALAAAAAATPLETGGILFGYRAGDDVVIESTLEIPDPGATTSSYRRDHARAQSALEERLKSAPAHVGYVGEWHSHPAPAGASGQDVREIGAISKVSPHPVALLVLRRNPHERWSLSAWIASGGVVNEVELANTDA